MNLANTFECTVQPLVDNANAAVTCAGEIVSAVSGWDVFTTIANWGILAIAAAALMVSAGLRKDSRLAMDATLNENYKSTQAQLDATRAATRADLDERKNSRELDITAAFISALDELVMTGARPAGEDGRGEALRLAANNVLLAAGRYQLFVGNPKALTTFQVTFLSLLDEFAPRSEDDFDSRLYERLTLAHAALRAEIFNYQQSKQISIEFNGMLGGMILMKLDGGKSLDQVLGLAPNS